MDEYTHPTDPDDAKSREYRREFRRVETEAYWTFPRVFVAGIGIFLVGFLITGAMLLHYKFWAPKAENARREVFENTQSYVQGKVRYLSTLRLEYEGASGTQKEALRRMIITEAAQVDNDKLPADLARFIGNLKGGGQ